MPAPFWCTYAWNRPTSTGAGGSDPLWLGWRGKPWLAIRLRGYAAFKWSQLILGRLAIINRDIAASALLIASTLALMAALDALERRPVLRPAHDPEPHGRRYGAAARAYRDGTGFDSLGCSL